MAKGDSMRSRVQAIRDLAVAVGLRVKTRIAEDGTPEYVLMDKKGEPLCIEYDTHDMFESIGVYAGSHPDFELAKEEYCLYF